jgi:hypothetical protein
MTADKEIIYVTGGSNGGGGPTIHLDEDCPNVRNSRVVIPRPRDVYPDDVDVCDVCSGTIDKSNQDHSHYRALKAAAKEVSD